MSKFRKNEEKLHNEVVLTVSHVIAETESNVRVPAPSRTEECRAEKMTCGTNAYPCRADFDSCWREQR